MVIAAVCSSCELMVSLLSHVEPKENPQTTDATLEGGDQTRIVGVGSDWHVKKYFQHGEEL